MAFWGCPVLKCKVLLRDSTFLILIEDENLKFIVFDAEKEVISQWKN
ncbi:hypothetical protein MiTa_04196 [Microcystis aeruginosa NIES-4264]|nr:hypothetical protein MiTa_04196 [Microcystis aeruginosa NIES-4264]